MSTTVNVTVKPGTSPSSRITSYEDTIGIPVLQLVGSGTDRVAIQFSPTEAEAAITYLRELAVVAADLADRVQDLAAEAVLTP